MNLFWYYFFLFIVYSFLGWIIENIYCSIVQKKLVLNRGFLMGPYIPIYGVTAIIMVVFLTEYKEDPFVLFCMSVVYASVLEYGTSLWMEKVFSARWWNYENEKFNLNGRICLKNSLLFGVLGLLLIFFINPLLILCIDAIPISILNILSMFFLFIFLIDILVTVIILSKLKLDIRKFQGDATEAIDLEVKKLFAGYKLFYKRLFRAFSKLSFTTTTGDVLIDKLRNKIDDMDQFLVNRKQEIIMLKKSIRALKTDAVSKEIIQSQKKKLKDLRRKKFQ